MTLPNIAIIANSQTPYRLHLHRRIAREIPQIRLWSIFTHETSNAPWSFTAAPEINPVLMGAGESVYQQSDPRNSLKEWQRGRRVIEFLRQHDVRAVLMMGYNDLGRLRVMRWCHARGVACLLFGDSNIHGDRATGAKAALKSLLLKRVLRWCRSVLVCGTLGRAYFNRYGMSDDRIFFFPYEPDYELIRSISPEQIAAAAERFHLQAGRRRLVFSGRLASEKRVDLLVDAFARIAGQRPDWDLLIIGNGPLREALAKRVPEQLSQRVQWTGFIDDQRTVSALYRASDALVLPSDFEPWALVINEAAAAGMAIVASNIVGAAAELVREGVNGRLFTPGSVDALAAAILDVTAGENIDRFKSASPAVLLDWQRRGDPVEGLKSALIHAGVLSGMPAGAGA
jgi:glycosyltransferase involved in cell wall biosynthesis